MLFDKTYKHSGDLGDIIYSLPVLKTYGKGILVIDDIKNLKSWIEPKGIQINLKKPDGTSSGICENKFNFIKPLLEKQKYVKEDMQIFKTICEGRFHPNDHQIFIDLKEKNNRNLFVSIPGFAFHADISSNVCDIENLENEIDDWVIEWAEQL